MIPLLLNLTHDFVFQRDEAHISTVQKMQFVRLFDFYKKEIKYNKTVNNSFGCTIMIENDHVNLDPTQKPALSLSASSCLSSLYS